MEVPAGGMHGAPVEPLDDDRTPSQSMSRLDSCESESKVSYLKAGKPAWGDIPFPKFPTCNTCNNMYMYMHMHMCMHMCMHM